MDYLLCYNNRDVVIFYTVVYGTKLAARHLPACSDARARLVNKVSGVPIVTYLNVFTAHTITSTFTDMVSRSWCMCV